MKRTRYLTLIDGALAMTSLIAVVFGPFLVIDSLERHPFEVLSAIGVLIAWFRVSWVMTRLAQTLERKDAAWSDHLVDKHFRELARREKLSGEDAWNRTVAEYPELPALFERYKLRDESL
jgi:hypothetical protein